MSSERNRTASEVESRTRSVGTQFARFASLIEAPRPLRPHYYLNRNRSEGSGLIPDLSHFVIPMHRS